MNAPVLHATPHAPVPHAAESPPGLVGLEYQLEWLSRHGSPSIRLMDDGWHANIDMRTPHAGVKFQVRADFNHRSPGDAAEVLIERVKAVLAGGA